MERNPPVEVVKNLLQDKKCCDCIKIDSCTRSEKSMWNTCENWKYDSAAQAMKKYKIAMDSIVKNSVRGSANSMITNEQTYKILSSLLNEALEGEKNESNNSHK